MRSLPISTLLGLVFSFRGVLAQFDNSPDFIQTTQVQPPSIWPLPSNACTVTLMQHVFANSYGVPSITQYAGPPSGCPGPWSNVILRLTIVSKGVQYDRLGTAWLDDNIVWEFSGAEPSVKNGVFQESFRETVEYSSLWSSPRKLTVDIGNVVNQQYTASLNATLSAIFVPGNPGARVADKVVSLNKGAAPGFWSLPAENGTTLATLPRNIDKASVEIFSSGNGNEEFWYANTIDNYDLTFNSSGVQLLPRGPFREVQISIDGKLAGVAWPFPIIFTGGIVPGLWRPLAGIEAYNLPTYQISLDPWLPLLADGNQHSFTLSVIGTKNLPLDNWFAAGNIKLWTSKNSNAPTTGRITQYSASAQPEINPSASVDANNQTLTQKVTASRRLSISSIVNLPGSKGYPIVKSWSQSMSYSNYQVVNQEGATQYVEQSTKGSDSTEEGTVFSYDYPLVMNSTFIATDNVTAITGMVTRGWNWSASRAYSPLKVQGTMRTQQAGSATYLNQNGKGSVSSGNTTQTMDFHGDGKGTGVKSYSRDVQVQLGQYVKDSEAINGRPVSHADEIANQPKASKRSFLGTVVGVLSSIAGEPGADFAPAPVSRMLGRYKMHVGQEGSHLV